MRRIYLLLAPIFAGLVLAVPSVALAGPTIVSLTFDDGWDSQQTVYSMLAAHGLLGTFYVNSGTIGTTNHFTWSQLESFNAGGNEVAGHTIDHYDLTTLSASEAQHEVCDDRTTILSHGFVVTNFAYPFGAYDNNTTTGKSGNDVSAIPQGCGYASARGAFGLHNITTTTDTRPYATSTPPPNPYEILTPCCIDNASFGGSTPTASALESYVQHAETGGGGWVIFVFHRICDNCGGDSPAPSMSPSEFNAFLDWLQSASGGAQVKTVAQVISDDTQAPVSSIKCGGAACSTAYGGPVSVSLSATDTGSGIFAIHYTTDGSDPTVASPTYSGPFSVSATTTVNYRAWDNAGNVEAANSQQIQIDATAPTSSISCGGASCSAGWYNGPVSVSLSATDDASGVAAIRYTTDGSDPTASSTSYSAPFTVSAATTVKYRAWDNAGNVETTKSQLIQFDTTAPTSSISCGGSSCSTSSYSGPVVVSLSATDNSSGVAVIRYTTDGSDPTTSSTTYAGPFTVAATTTVKYRAWDNAGNVEATNARLIQISNDTTAPTSTIACNGAACSAGWYGATVSVALSATDPDDTVAAIRYTTDGSDPTPSSTTYTAPFTVSATTTVKYRAWDNAGNVETTKSQLIQIDTTAPSSTISCNGTTCSTGWYRAPVTVNLAASDAQSGVAAIRFTTDGSTPTASSATYTASVSVSSTTTVRYRTWDNAGNVEATKSQLIQIDTTNPTVSITSPSNGASVTGNAKIAASAADAGSAIAQVSFYVDGALIGTTSNAPYMTPWNTKKSTRGSHLLTAVAQDRAGNTQTSAAVQVTVT